MIEIIKQFWPLIVLQLIFQIIALINLSKRQTVRFKNKWIWVVIIIVGEILGTIAYFIFRGENYENGSEDN